MSRPDLQIAQIEQRLTILRAQLAHHNSIDVAEEIDQLEEDRAVMAGECHRASCCPECGADVYEYVALPGRYACRYCDHEFHRCIKVEYDPEFFGGDYARGNEKTVYLRVSDVDQHGMEDAFRVATGHAPENIIFHSSEEFYDEGGNELEMV